MPKMTIEEILNSQKIGRPVTNELKDWIAARIDGGSDYENISDRTALKGFPYSATTIRLLVNGYPIYSGKSYKVNAFNMHALIEAVEYLKERKPKAKNVA